MSVERRLGAGDHVAAEWDLPITTSGSVALRAGALAATDDPVYVRAP
jgi:hypothetical protein